MIVSGPHVTPESIVNTSRPITRSIYTVYHEHCSSCSRKSRWRSVVQCDGFVSAGMMTLPMIQLLCADSYTFTSLQVDHSPVHTRSLYRPSSQHSPLRRLCNASAGLHQSLKTIRIQTNLRSCCIHMQVISSIGNVYVHAPKWSPAGKCKTGGAATGLMFKSLLVGDVQRGFIDAALQVFNWAVIKLMTHVNCVVTMQRYQVRIRNAVITSDATMYTL